VLRPCEICETPLAYPDDPRCHPKPWVCSPCFFGGRLLVNNLRGAVMVLDEAAGRAGADAQWEVMSEYGPPGTAPSDGASLLLDLQDEPACGGPYLRITPFNRKFTFRDTIAEVEKSGWSLFSYKEDDKVFRRWPAMTKTFEVLSTSMTREDGTEVKGGPCIGRFERLRGLETEQLPMLIGEAVAWARASE
jgi:hypothetical protein